MDTSIYKTDSSVKWTPKVGPCLFLLRLFIYKMDTIVRLTLPVPKVSVSDQRVDCTLYLKTEQKPFTHLLIWRVIFSPATSWVKVLMFNILILQKVNDLKAHTQPDHTHIQTHLVWVSEENFNDKQTSCCFISVGGANDKIRDSSTHHDHGLRIWDPAVKFNYGTERKVPNQILKLQDSQYTINELIFKVTSCIGINASPMLRRIPLRITDIWIIE